MLDWEWYQDGNTFRVFMHLLIKACFKETKYKGIVIPRGSYVISSSGLAEELGITRQSARTALNHLKSTNEITIKSTNRFTVITIVNYCIYQGEDSSSNQQTNQPANHQLTNNQPATNQPSEEESKKERMKEKKIQNEKAL